MSAVRYLSPVTVNLYSFQTCIARAWDFSKPFVVAPAMNTFMWDHPYTARHLSDLKKLGILEVEPIAKRLACGDIGMYKQKHARVVEGTICMCGVCHRFSCQRTCTRHALYGMRCIACAVMRCFSCT